MKNIFTVFIGGGIGSVARYLISIYSLKFFPVSFPWGTFISNTIACLIMAVSIILLKDTLVSQPVWRFLIITGFCGGFSTFSTFGYETYALFRTHHTYLALLNVALSVAVALIVIVVLLKDVHWQA